MTRELFSSRETTASRVEDKPYDPTDPTTSADRVGVFKGRTSEKHVPAEVVSLRPLDARQIALLARAYGVIDADAFMAALEMSSGLFLAERPRDLEWLADYWNRARRLGTLWDMLAANVTAKLGEADPARAQTDPLSPDRAWQAAERLAVATVLCRQTAFRIPDLEMAVDKARPALDAGQILEDWPPPEIAALMRRPLFDEASAGRVRLHNPTTRGYLAGRWMLRMLDEECPVPTVTDMLLRPIYDRPRAIPSMVEVAGWVVCRHPPIRRAFIGAAPEVVLLAGDAAQVPVEDRVRALRSLAKAFAGGRRLERVISDAQYARLADPALDVAVDELLRAADTSTDVRWFLLNLARVGGLPRAAETALKLATDANVEHEVRLAAIGAVGGAGTPVQKQSIRQYALSAPDLHDAVLAEVGHALYPGTLTVDDLAMLLRKFSVVDVQKISGPTYTVASDWVDQCAAADRIPLLKALLDLATEPPLAGHCARAPLLSRRFGWLIHAVVRCAQMTIEALPAGATVPKDLTRALLLVQSVKADHDIYLLGERELRAVLQREPVVRRTLMHAYLVATRGDPDSNVGFIGTEDELYDVVPSDIEWLLGEVTKEKSATTRFALLKGAVEIWIVCGRPNDMLTSLATKIAAADLPTGLTERLSTRLQPPPEREGRQRRTRGTKRRKAEAAMLADARRQLKRELDGIRTGEAFGALHYIVDQLNRAPGASHARWGQTNFHQLETLFGPEIAAAAREGLRHVWRRWRPPPPSELADRAGVENGVPVGLTALALEEDEGVDFTTFSDEDALTATHYALRELNGFPTWFGALIAARPDVISPLLLSEITAALAGTDGDASADATITLQAIRLSAPARNAVANPLIGLLEAGTAPTVHHLAACLAIIQAADGYDAPRLRRLAAERTGALWRTDIQSALVWLQVWLHLDAAAAWTFFENRFDTGPLPADELVFRLLLLLSDDLGQEEAGTGAYLRNPTLLARMIPTIYRHQPADPTLRDDSAPHRSDRSTNIEVWLAWNRILGLLEQIPGSQAHDALRAMAVHPELVALRPFFRTAVERHAGKAVEPAAWAPADLAQFVGAHEAEPATSHDLFRLVLERLDGIKHDIETGDFGDRGIFGDGIGEEILQRYFAGRLERASRRRYEVTREEEVAEHKKPDIRIRHSRAGIVSIEIKPLDSKRYTVEQLKQTLSEQLVGQYMRAARSKHGVLLVCLVRKRTWRLINSAQMIGFDQVLALLADEACRLKTTQPDIQGLAVIGIDATPWEKEQRSKICGRRQATPRRRA